MHQHVAQALGDLAVGGVEQAQLELALRVIKAVEIAGELAFGAQHHDADGVAVLAVAESLEGEAGGFAQGSQVAGRPGEVDKALADTLFTRAFVARDIEESAGGGLGRAFGVVEADHKESEVLADGVVEVADAPLHAVEDDGADDRAIEVHKREDDRLAARDDVIERDAFALVVAEREALGQILAEALVDLEALGVLWQFVFEELSRRRGGEREREDSRREEAGERVQDPCRLRQAITSGAHSSAAATSVPGWAFDAPVGAERYSSTTNSTARSSGMWSV
ncbi:MAG: hypothetical protein AAF235_00595 [Planctomycetota bacterium]